MRRPQDGSSGRTRGRWPRCPKRIDRGIRSWMGTTDPRCARIRPVLKVLEQTDLARGDAAAGRSVISDSSDPGRAGPGKPRGAADLAMRGLQSL